MISLEHKPYALSEIATMLASGEQLTLSDNLVDRIQRGCTFLNKKLQEAKDPIYGINTGFGSLYNVTIAQEDIQKLQENLVKSHACGVGDRVPNEVVRLMLLLKVLGLSKGNSGVRLQTVEMLLAMYNRGILPVVYEQGSLGASGDLAPLAHLSLPLIGLGEVEYQGKVMASQEALAAEGLKPLQLQAKEGLALLNGTQFMSAFGVHILIHISALMPILDKTAALSLEAFDGRIEAFDEAVHTLRPHSGQIETGRIMRELLKGSASIAQPKAHVQDPYSFRCIPQVHGASRDAIAYVMGVFETEINSVTDNPTLVPEEDKIISAGNFHGQPLAIALDFLSIAMAELASISERRTYKLISGQRGLPAYLVAAPGLNSGFMIAQYTAASIVSQNKQLCTPASVDTIDSSNGQEDHVSMGANAATKALRVFQNFQKVIAIELMTGAQAKDFRTVSTSPILEEWHRNYRKHVPFIQEDVVMSDMIARSIQFVSEA